MKRRVAVLFGGRSPEHDVSIKTGLQALDALDQQLFDAIPVYIGLDGRWWIGDALREDATFIPADPERVGLVQVNLLPSTQEAEGLLVGEKGGLLGRKQVKQAIDVALLALHGLNGEDGRIQGLLEMAGIPYTGMRLPASALLMDKAATKSFLAANAPAAGEIPLLPHRVIERPYGGMMPSPGEVEGQLGGMAYPLIVKPNHLGSSVGVARVETIDELRAALPAIFSLDPQVIVEPCVQHLVEYNISVRRNGPEILTSAIERPKNHEQLLDFRSKYLPEGSGMKKTGGATSMGMLSLTRDIHPQLPETVEANIRSWAAHCFTLVGGSGAPRIDFLSNAQTGEVWLNEVNPCPGSFAYFLWEAASPPLAFGDLLTRLIEEAASEWRAGLLPKDPTLPDARLYAR